jgi:hypothetical protein
MMRWLPFVLVLLSGAMLTAQDQPRQDFVIDKTKPYVYLKFDHIGPRIPVQNGEGNKGIWLRVVNNCHIPIVLLGFNPPKGDPGVGLFDEIVREEPLLTFSANPEPEPEPQSADVNTPKAPVANENSEASDQQNHDQMPEGYSFELPGAIHVPPGQEILFSVPMNHVTDEWYLRVRFALDLDKSSATLGPYTYLPFHFYEIPKIDRSKGERR